MYCYDLPDEVKSKVWQRQSGMCGLTGKKFEADNFNDANCEFFSINPNTQPGDHQPEYLVMLWKSSEVSSLLAEKSENYKKYEFPYANFEYSYEEKMADIRETIDECVKIAETSEDWKKSRNHLRETMQMLKNLELGTDDYEQLSQTLSSSFETLNKRQTQQKENEKKYSEEIFNRLINEIKQAVDIAADEKNFKNARQSIIAVQNEFRKLTLAKEHQDELYNKITEAFDRITVLQSEERENYEMECIENYHRLKAIIDEAVIFSKEATNFGKARENLISAQSQIKGNKLKRNQREELYQIIRDSFEALNERQSAEREEFEKECEINYKNLKTIVDEACNFAANSPDYKEAREALINAQGTIKGMKLKRAQRDELYAQIREIFNGINEKQSAEREGFEQECNANYEKLSHKVVDAFVEVDRSSDFRNIRDTLISVQSEVRILKLKRDQRNELFAKIREAFAKFDERKQQYFDRRKQEKQSKLDEIKSGLIEKLDRLNDTIEADKKSLEEHNQKLTQASEENSSEDDQNSLKEIINSIETRIKEKEERINDTKVRIDDIQKDIDKL